MYDSLDFTLIYCVKHLFFFFSSLKGFSSLKRSSSVRGIVMHLCGIMRSSYISQKNERALPVRWRAPAEQPMQYWARGRWYNYHITEDRCRRSYCTKGVAEKRQFARDNSKANVPKDDSWAFTWKFNDIFLAPGPGIKLLRIVTRSTLTVLCFFIFWKYSGLAGFALTNRDDLFERRCLDLVVVAQHHSVRIFEHRDAKSV